MVVQRGKKAGMGVGGGLHAFADMRKMKNFPETVVKRKSDKDEAR